MLLTPVHLIMPEAYLREISDPTKLAVSNNHHPNLSSQTVQIALSKLAQLYDLNSDDAKGIY